MAAPWFDVEVEKNNAVVVDCGYLKEQLARDRVDMLCEKLKLGRRCIYLMLNDRLVAKIPPTKVQKLEPLGVVPVKTYWGTTHSFQTAEAAGGE